MTSDATTKTDFDLITDTVTVAVSVLFKMSKFCCVFFETTQQQFPLDFVFHNNFETSITTLAS
jgi:hypothetical protein